MGSATLAALVMSARSSLLSLVAAAVLASVAMPAHADGKRDLQDGVALYEALDTDRAILKLRSALASSDLGAADRSKAYLFLGIVLFETGQEAEAGKSWGSAFELDPEIPIPDGASPTTVEAIEKARADFKAAPPPVPTEPVPELPKLGEPTPPGPIVTPPPAEPKDEGPDWLLWGGIGGGVAAAAIVAVVIVAAGGGSTECEGAGGCALVTFR